MPKQKKSKRFDTLQGLRKLSGMDDESRELYQEDPEQNWEKWLANFKKMLLKAIPNQPFDFGNKAGLGKMQMVFMAALAVLTLVNAIKTELEKTPNLPLRDKVGRLFNMHAKEICQAGFSVVSILGGSVKLINALTELLPDVPSLKEVKGVVKGLDEFNEKIAQVIDTKVNVLDDKIGKAEMKDSALERLRSSQTVEEEDERESFKHK